MRLMGNSYITNVNELTFMITIGYVNVDMRELYSPVRFLLKCCSVS